MLHLPQFSEEFQDLLIEDQEAGTAVIGVVPLLIFLNEASINAFLDLALDFLKLFLRSGIGTQT